MSTDPESRSAAPTGATHLLQVPAAVWILGFVSMLMDISSEMIHSLLPLFLVTSLGASVFMIGVIEGLAESTALIVKVFAGVLSDYLGKRKGLAVFGYGLGALSKPLFAVAQSSGAVLSARLLDRLGKGIRGAPRDALVADITPQQLRGAAFGLRQSLDTVGALLGPLIAVALMLLWANDFRAVFWVAAVPGLMAVALLLLGVREPPRQASERRKNPITRHELARLGGAYWRVVIVGAVFTLARFSEAFLVLRAQQAGIPIALVPLVMAAMNLVYAASAYPFGKLSDSVSHRKLLAIGLVVLIAADLVLASDTHWVALLIGVILWGLHMGMTQGLLAAIVADTAPADRRGTAYGFFNLVSGIAMLVASGLAGLLWDRLGASFTFYAGAAFSVAALIGLSGLMRPASPRCRNAARRRPGSAPRKPETSASRPSRRARVSDATPGRECNSTALGSAPGRGPRLRLCLTRDRSGPALGAGYSLLNRAGRDDQRIRAFGDLARQGQRDLGTGHHQTGRGLHAVGNHLVVDAVDEGGRFGELRRGGARTQLDRLFGLLGDLVDSLQGDVADVAANFVHADGDTRRQFGGSRIDAVGKCAIDGTDQAMTAQAIGDDRLAGGGLIILERFQRDVAESLGGHDFDPWVVMTIHRITPVSLLSVGSDTQNPPFP